MRTVLPAYVFFSKWGFGSMDGYILDDDDMNVSVSVALLDISVAGDALTLSKMQHGTQIKAWVGRYGKNQA